MTASAQSILKRPAASSCVPDAQFRRALAGYGHVEGKTIEIHYRWSGGVQARNADLAQELVALGVEVIVAAATPAVTAAKQVTSTIPIVMVEVGDPAAYGIVPSLMRPGGNVTGMSNGLHEFGPRSLRLFKEVVPDAIHVAVLGPVHTIGVTTKSFEDAAHALGMIPRTYVAGTADALHAVLGRLDRRTCDVLFVIPDQGLAVNRSIIISVATSHFPSRDACARTREGTSSASLWDRHARAAKHRIPAHDLAYQPILGRRSGRAD